MTDLHYALVCITRVGRILSLQGERALVGFLDHDVTMEIDVSMVDARKDAYVEVFGDRAISRLTKREAEARKRVWSELRELGGG
jgi:hydrogenase maturation factor